MQFTSPAGWIPPEFREMIYQTMTDEELEPILGTIGCFDESGRQRFYSKTELRALGIDRKIIGVMDTRTGEVHPTLSNNTFMIH